MTTTTVAVPFDEPRRWRTACRVHGVDGSRRPAGAISSVCSPLLFALFPVWFVVLAAFSKSAAAEQPERSGRRSSRCASTAS